MNDRNVFASVQKPLSDAREIFILLPQEPNYDKTAAGLGLFLSLKKTGKQVSVACPSVMRVKHSSLFGVDKITDKITGKNLVVSFDYAKDSVEKVSYNIDENQKRFNLVIQSKNGYPPLSSERVNYSQTGSEADLVFTVGVTDLNNLGRLYQDSKQIFEEQKVVQIEAGGSARQLGQHRLIFPQAPSCSEVVTTMISWLNLPVDGDIATNLYFGIQKATGNFSSPRVWAGTFEAAAFCLRAGAKQKQISYPKRPATRTRAAFQPMPKPVSAALKPAPDNQPPESSKNQSEKPASDWFEPKIYRGDTKV